MNIDLFKRYSELIDQKKSSNEQLKDVNEQLALLEPQLVEELLNAGVDKISVDGNTFYSYSKIFPKFLVEDKFVVVEALKQSNLASLCPETINNARFRAYLQELYDNGENVPEQLQAYVEFNPVPKLGRRKSS